MRLLLLLLFAATPLVAQTATAVAQNVPTSTAATAPREAFPSDFVPSPCAPSAEEMCGGVKKVDFANLAYRFRGVTISHDWLDAHWDEMKQDALGPLCTKMANCYTIPGNTTTWCLNLFREEFPKTCDRFPEGSTDREQCVMFAHVYFITIGVKTNIWKRAQECTRSTAESGPGTLEAWVAPSPIRLTDDETITVHVIDSKRRIPVKARITADGGGRLKSTDGPQPLSGVPSTWVRRLKRVPNAAGHEDLVAPTLTIEAQGYETIRMPLPVTLPQLKVTMTPPASELKPGRNLITITAVDSETNEPVEMRVMGGTRILGTTNKPFELTIRRSQPEIWITSLFDRYSDIVVAPAP